MLDLRPEDVFHKSQLNQLLIEVIDRPVLAHNLAFKGGTCAAMLGFLDRFSVDLDFDLVKNAEDSVVRAEFRKIFDYLRLRVVGELDKVVFFELRYPNDPGKRNTIKISVSSIRVAANQYKVQYFTEIDRLMNSQTVETMFANKLVAVMDRYQLHRAIAGRDIYDIHYFFVHGYAYHAPIIHERTGLEASEYFAKLADFIKNHVTQTLINEDLNTVLPKIQFQRIRKVLVPETLSFLRKEQYRLENQH